MDTATEPPSMTFHGRDAELQQLLALYRDVVHGSGPAVAAVLGEPGLGKTRLVQEFYRSVAIEASGDSATAGYWPPRLSQHGRNLSVNPAIEDCGAGAPMPFLWWGIRLTDPLERNAVANDPVTAHVEALKPHLLMFDLERHGRTLGGIAFELGNGKVYRHGVTLVAGKGGKKRKAG